MAFPTTNQEAQSALSLELLKPCRELTFSELQLATQNFNDSLVIGHGGFGKVYKGTITIGPNLLTTVAIKRLDSTSNQGALEFWAEVKLLSKLRHCHLVSLIGYCNDGQEMILVYEYMPRGTLEDHLHKHVSSLPWLTRIKICIGAARGLDYLHTGTGIEHGVIHRDVKSSNILLHKSWAAKISDFGLSKLGPTNQPSTYVNTMVKGTFGYLDPGYFQTGRLTRKSDVYAFGVVLFEVLCGKKAVDRTLDEEQWGLASWAQDSIKEGRLKQIVDTIIRDEISPKCLKEFAQLAERCLHSHPKERPTMAEVVVGLESVLTIQEKANITLQPAVTTLFGRKTLMIPFSSTEENSEGRNVKSLELYLDTLGGENKVLYRFDFDSINLATENFSGANIISQYSDGYMYKGTLKNGQDISIARPYSKNMNEQLITEASILAELEHENIIQLLGYCIEGSKVLLVYEFAPHATLDGLLYDPKCTVLDWNKRYKIILGVAKGLLHLHKHAPIRLIYRDVNPGNILLDECFDPKLSDFGLATVINETDCINVDAVRVTFGYIAPELLMKLHLSTKADVYSFGVLVLETITGRRPFDISLEDDRYCLLEYVWRNWLEETSSNIIDPKIDIDSSLMSRFIEIGLLCVQVDAADRPTMEEVVDILLDKLSLTLRVSEMRTRMIGQCSNCISAPFHDYRINTVEGRGLNSLDLFLATLGGQNKVLKMFDFDTINVATGKFSGANIISQHSDGYMYKGRLLNGEYIAIARPYSDKMNEQLIIEASIMGKLEHENLIQLLGYSVEGTKVLLVYEFAPFASLDCLIYDPKSTLLDWNNRYKIILGVARVLLYLHKHAPIRIIHRDVNPGNILLDESFDPKLSDFGLATPINETDCIHVDDVRVTFGYIAPELLTKLNLSTKADVFGFGVLVLETITGRRPFDISLEDDRYCLLEYVWRNWLEGTSSNIIDPRIKADSSSLTRFIEIGLLCVQVDAADRPTMDEVVDMLLGSSSLTLHVSRMRSVMKEEYCSNCVNVNG